MSSSREGLDHREDVVSVISLPTPVMPDCCGSGLEGCVSCSADKSGGRAHMATMGFRGVVVFQLTLASSYS